MGLRHAAGRSTQGTSKDLAAYVAALFGYEDAQEMIRDIATASKKVSDEVDAS